jgi:hypothetical protein
MAEKSVKEFDRLVQDLPGFKVFTRNAETREERDDPHSIFGVQSYGDLSRKVRERLQARSGPSSIPPKTQLP